MGSCWSGASNDDTADKTLSGKDAITEADVKVIAVGRSENLGGATQQGWAKDTFACK